MIITALDPGGTTGWATVKWPEEDLTKLTWQFGDIKWLNHHAHLRHHLSLQTGGTRHIAPTADNLRRVVCEGWDNRANPAAVQISLEYIGVVKGWCQEFAIPLDLPKPAEKEWADDKKLKALGLYHRGKKDTNDAVRHLVKILVFRYKHPTILQSLKDNL